MKKVARLRNPEEIAANSERMTVRTTGRIKKAKVVFDPSDNYLPRQQRASAGSVNSNQPQSDNPSDSSIERRQKEEKPRVTSGDSMDDNICYICGRKESKKNKTKLISCKDCKHKTHITCLELEYEDLDILRDSYRCALCQSCSSCYEDFRDNRGFITCTKCVKSFHFACHIPSMAGFPKQLKWFCSKCTIPKKIPLVKVIESKISPPDTENKSEVRVETPKINEVSHAVLEKKPPVALPVALPVSLPVAQPVANGNKLLRITPNDLCEIPNVKNWSAGEVMEFFKKFFPEEAYIFKDHDIDGQSLLLIKRSDVVNKLAIRLGPALRIYNLILKIQAQSTDPTIGW